MAPEHKNSHSGTSEMPKRGHKVFPLWRGESSWLNKGNNKKSNAETAKIWVRANLVSVKLWWWNKTSDSFFCCTSNCNVAATVCSRFLVRTEKSLGLLVGEMNRKYVPTDRTCCTRNHWIYGKTSASKPRKWVTNSFAARKDGGTDSGIDLDWKI